MQQGIKKLQWFEYLKYNSRNILLLCQVFANQVTYVYLCQCALMHVCCSMHMYLYVHVYAVCMCVFVCVYVVAVTYRELDCLATVH